jgi:pilus assembly protein Flp/PilA
MLTSLYCRTVAALKSEEGATAVEYGIMVALIAAAIVVTVTAVGGQLNAVFTGVATTLGWVAPAQ